MCGRFFARVFILNLLVVSLSLAQDDSGDGAGSAETSGEKAEASGEEVTEAPIVTTTNEITTTTTSEVVSTTKPATTMPSPEGSYLQQWLLAWIRGEPTPAPPTTRRPLTTSGLPGLLTRLPIPQVPGRQTSQSTTGWPFMGMVPRVPGAGVGVQRGEESRPSAQSGGSEENYRGISTQDRQQVGNNR